VNIFAAQGPDFVPKITDNNVLVKYQCLAFDAIAVVAQLRYILELMATNLNTSCDSKTVFR